MNSQYFSAHFLSCAASISAAPEDIGAEVAFAGRSNAGKSRAINSITNQNNLAKTSKTPGRTQLLVFFEVINNARLVDLPGYGYAKVPETVKRKWQTMVDNYLTHRRSLRGVIQVMDIRHPLKDFDLQMLQWCMQAGLPAHILLTKADKLKTGQAKRQLDATQKEIGHQFPNATIQLFSASKRTGIDEVHDILDKWLMNQ